jgi:hypothetical protein
MRCTYFFLVVLATAAFLSCSGDGGSEPEIEEEEPLVEATIGPEGGELVATDVQIIIPAGVLEESEQLALYEAEVPDAVTGSASGEYRLEGLPDMLGGPLTIRLRCSEAVTGDTLIVVSELEVDPESGDTLVFQDYVPATMMGDTAVGEWPEVLDSNGGSGFKQVDRTGDVLGHRYVHVPAALASIFSKHFEIRIPVSVLHHAQEIADSLESAYQKFLGLGFDYQFMRDPNERIDGVEVKCSYSWAGVAGISSIRFAGQPWEHTLHLRISYPELLADGATRVSRKAMGRFFRIVHDAQIPCIGLPPPCGARDGYKWTWLKLGGALWAEGFFQPVPLYTPDDFQESADKVPYGLRVADEGSPSPWGNEYGYALSALLKYLCSEERCGAAWLVNVYSDVREGVSGSKLIVDNVPYSTDVWWPDYLRELYSGKIYTVPWEEVSESVSEIMRVYGEDTTHTYEGGMYADLTARLYEIDLSHWDAQEDAYLKLAVRSDEVNPDFLEVQLFAKEGDGLQLLAYGQEVRVEDLEAVQASTPHLVAVVANADYDASSLSPSKIALDITVGASDLSRFETATIRMQYHAYWNTGEFPSQGLYISTTDSDAEGVWDGFTYNAEWDFVESGARDSGQVTITLDPETLDIVSWSVDYTWDYFEYGFYNTYHASGAGVPKITSAASAMEFRLMGTAMCNSTSNIYVRQEENGEIKKELLNFGCDTNSYLEIEIQDLHWRRHGGKTGT